MIYPVVQYDGENLDENGNAYYMDKDIYGNYLDSGTIFMDYRDNFGPDKSQQSQNIMLYGHNMLKAQNLLRFIITGRTIRFMMIIL